MAFIYRVTFDIQPDQMGSLKIGQPLQRVLGYLKILLPSETGFISSRAMYSTDHRDKIDMIFESVWEEWEDVEAHRQSSLVENKILTEFEPHVKLENLSVRLYEEVA